MTILAASDVVSDVTRGAKVIASAGSLVSYAANMNNFSSAAGGNSSALGVFKAGVSSVSTPTSGGFYSYKIMSFGDFFKKVGDLIRKGWEFFRDYIDKMLEKESEEDNKDGGHSEEES